MKTTIKTPKLKWLAMLYNYPYAFLQFKKDIKQFYLNSEELENVEWILIKQGEID